jgi:large subunit ribosomal protein L9
MATKQRKRRNQVPKGPHGGVQIVLIEDVPHVGKQGEVVEVKAGFARNYLLPRGMATIPTPHNLKLLEKHKIRVKQAREARIADLRALAEQVQKMMGITIEANANEENHLYGSVGPEEISAALKAKALPVDPDMVLLEGAIKELGLYSVKLHLGYEITGEVTVAVVKKVASK